MDKSEHRPPRIPPAPPSTKTRGDRIRELFGTYAYYSPRRALVFLAVYILLIAIYSFFLGAWWPILFGFVVLAGFVWYVRPAYIAIREAEEDHDRRMREGKRN